MDIQQQKEELRQQFLEHRQNISEDEYRTASDIIIQKVQQLTEFKEAKNIHSYISMNDRGEVNTHDLIQEMMASGKKVIVPVTNFQKGSLTHVRLNSYEELESNKWGVLEPNVGEEASPEELDFVIVPMVGADEACNRIGYGKGFYDRFLKGVNCPKIGLLFERNVVEKLPTESFDIPLDIIITEQRVIHRE